jgi:hypothetical protein
VSADVEALHAEIAELRRLLEQARSIAATLAFLPDSPWACRCQD